MTRFIPAICCVIAAAVPVVAETPKDSIASLIQAGDRKGALARIRAGADVNEAQPDGTRPIHWAVYHVDYELLDALIEGDEEAVRACMTHHLSHVRTLWAS